MQPIVLNPICYLRLREENPREGEFRVEATEEAVEGGGAGLVGGVRAGSAVHRQRGVAGRRPGLGGGNNRGCLVIAGLVVTCGTRGE